MTILTYFLAFYEIGGFTGLFLLAVKYEAEIVGESYGKFYIKQINPAIVVFCTNCGYSVYTATQVCRNCGETQYEKVKTWDD